MVDDDKSNVIPFRVNGVTFTDLGPPTDMTKERLSVLVNSIAAYGFECEAGPLENCAEWTELRRRLTRPGVGTIRAGSRGQSAEEGYRFACGFGLNRSRSIAIPIAR